MRLKAHVLAEVKAHVLNKSCYRSSFCEFNLKAQRGLPLHTAQFTSLKAILVIAGVISDHLFAGGWQEFNDEYSSQKGNPIVSKKSSKLFRSGGQLGIGTERPIEVDS